MARAFVSLRRRAEFTRLYRRGRRLALPSFSCYALAVRRGAGERGAGERAAGARPREARLGERRVAPRIGIAAGKEIGRAVARNRLRRRVKCSFDELDAGRRLGLVDLLVVARVGAADLPYREVRAQLARAVAFAETVS